MTSTLTTQAERTNHHLTGSRDRERIKTTIVQDHGDLASLLAAHIVEIIQRETAAKGHCVLGLATGSTPIGIYRELIRRHQEGEVDFSRVITFNLDEYYPMSPSSIHSYRMFMRENFFSHVNLDLANTHVPDGSVPRSELAAHCEAYENSIREAGGIDFQILGIGRSGHIGFNEPGSPPESRTRLITLDTITRKDAAADFFGEDNVPAEAITMGIATILDAKEIALIATGEHKANVARRAVEEPISQDVTATYLQQHPNATVFLDLSAAGELTRIKTPWILESVEWTDHLTERAVVWLAEHTGKAILKLAKNDYRENHLSSLLSRHGTAGALNGSVFNGLQDKIRGRAKLASGKRVVVFSPHPDDDVISMGGILRKLCENENQIIVAYMTSGNIAVFDHDILRHLDFVDRSARALGLNADEIHETRLKIEQQFGTKRPGEVDSSIVLDLKRIIRESEAVSAIEAVGLPRTAARFLDLPFYHTGEVRKRPVGDEDVRIVHNLLCEVRPDLVFVAGDMSDPHGTHRMCKMAIDEALAVFEGPRPEVWLYRGAWEEWSIAEADVLVPLSQEELSQKIMAIFKHQSQKDVAPFPGGFDDREFWQRVEDRNLDTAKQADRMGLPEYYAMEAFVVE
jgi:glucosamine-6-phosphate deaminase